MYTVYGKTDTRAFRVLWMLEELGEAYDFVKTGPQSEDARARNLLGKVPVLEVEGDSFGDSVAIMQFLADKHGRFTAPAGTVARGKQDAVTNFINDEMDALLWMGTRHMFMLPDDQKMPEIRGPLKWEFARSIDRLAGFLGDRPFLMGDEMTVPDILATHCGNWAFGAKYPVENEDVLAYFKRMRSREAYQRVKALG
ncbi:glutathione S-transferase family protein [Maritimibacter sp. DP1N21-5]|uniref:glutathione S-transferase family protein n=1 Tax=Maritimibacter sp. DP1N21-5 TaxID=2836867 RepID=UPI001C469B11|nr:glutathione S-transferase family protein [Maritimibacter sp. DP1N21-5]MBV7408832.1 glutathione S-transferase family protein [Maritimibacter sp. DP1N21-5]